MSGPDAHQTMGCGGMVITIDIASCLSRCAYNQTYRATRQTPRVTLTFGHKPGGRTVTGTAYNTPNVKLSLKSERLCGLEASGRSVTLDQGQI